MRMLMLALVGLLPAAQGGAGDGSDWTRVMSLGSGREIRVSAGDQLPATRHFVAADPSALTVLDVARAEIPAALKRALVKLAADNPEHLTAAMNGRELIVLPNLSIGPRGLFVDSRKVADLEQVVVRLPRERVREISGRVGRPGRLGPGIALIVAGSAMAIGNFIGLSSEQGRLPYEKSRLGQDGYLGAAGVAIGVSLAALGGFIVHKSRSARGVIYRASRDGAVE